MQQALNLTQVDTKIPIKSTQTWKIRIMERKKAREALKAFRDEMRREEIKKKQLEQNQPEPVEKAPEEKEIVPEATKKFEQRQASCPVYAPPMKRNKKGFRDTQNFDWSFLGIVERESPTHLTIDYNSTQTEFKTGQKSKVPKISITTASAKVKHDNAFMTMSELDFGNFLTAPSPRAKSTTKSRHSGRSSRLSDSTNAFSDASPSARSARSSAMDTSRFESEMENSVIKVSDLLNRTYAHPVLGKSKIRRDMFGNLRAVPRQPKVQVVENQEFTVTHQHRGRSISTLLDPHLYVGQLLERVSQSVEQKAIDLRVINKERPKYSGKHKLLKGYWNPYLMMQDGRKFAHFANPHI